MCLLPGCFELANFLVLSFSSFAGTASSPTGLAICLLGVWVSFAGCRLGGSCRAFFLFHPGLREEKRWVVGRFLEVEELALPTLPFSVSDPIMNFQRN